MPKAKPHSVQRRSRTQLSWRKKLLFSIIATVGFFAILEFSLAVMGVNPTVDTSDPYVGFDNQVPLMQVAVDESGQSVVSTAANKLVWFNYQSFPREKAAGTKRVFCLGGSTTYGRPYEDLTSYSGWLREFLPLADTSQRWEVVNAGGVSYASYRVAAVMEELAQYEPDLFIIYTAHNEFLERRTYADLFEKSDFSFRASAALRHTRTWTAMESLVHQVRSHAKPHKETLAGEVDEMLNHTIGPAQYHRDDVWRRGVIQHYETNLHRMVSIAESVGAQVLFITPSSNEKDCSPFKSEPSDALSAQELARFESAVEQAERANESGELDKALDHYRDAAAIDPRHAHVQYEWGRLLLSMDRVDEASQAFSRAIQEDICPLRAVEEIADAIDRVARQRGVPLVDFDKRLRAQCNSELGHPCLGGEYFLDHVHPTIEIHQQLALWLIEVMDENGMVVVKPLTVGEIADVDRRVRSQIDEHAQGVALRNLAKVLHWSGKFEEAAPRARDALQRIENDAESRFVLADCLDNLGRGEEAFAEYETLFAKGDYPKAYLPYGEHLLERADVQAARTYLALAALYETTDGHRARAHYLLGIAHLELQEFEFAIESLELANELYPDDPDTLSLLAEAKQGIGQTARAIELYQRVIRLDHADGSAHHRLGLLLLKSNQPDEALRHFQIALAADPTNREIENSIEIARLMSSTAP